MPGSIPASATVEALQRPDEPRGGWRVAVADFIRRRPLGAIGAAIVLVMVVLAASAGLLAPYDPLETDYGAMLAAPATGPSQKPASTTMRGCSVIGTGVPGRGIATWDAAASATAKPTMPMTVAGTDRGRESERSSISSHAPR